MNYSKIVLVMAFTTASLGAIWDEPVIRHVPFDEMEDADLIEAQKREDAHCIEEQGPDQNPYFQSR